MTTHTGTWAGRERMARNTWRFGAGMIAMGAALLWFDKDGAGLIMSGAGMITLVVGIMVAGKVTHDKNVTNGVDP